MFMGKEIGKGGFGLVEKKRKRRENFYFP